MGTARSSRASRAENRNPHHPFLRCNQEEHLDDARYSQPEQPRASVIVHRLLGEKK